MLNLSLFYLVSSDVYVNEEYLVDNNIVFSMINKASFYVCLLKWKEGKNSFTCKLKGPDPIDSLIIL